MHMRRENGRCWGRSTSSISACRHVRMLESLLFYILRYVRTGLVGHRAPPLFRRGATPPGCQPVLMCAYGVGFGRLYVASVLPGLEPVPRGLGVDPKASA